MQGHVPRRIGSPAASPLHRIRQPTAIDAFCNGGARISKPPLLLLMEEPRAPDETIEAERNLFHSCLGPREGAS